MKDIAFKMSTVALMMSSIIGYPVLAQAAEGTKPPAGSSTAPGAAQNLEDNREISQAGHSALVRIDDARFAIFNGDPKVAIKLMESAKSFLAQADRDTPSTGGAMQADKAKLAGANIEGPKMRSVQVDGQLALADDFVMSPEKKSHVDKANESLKKGDRATGLEELRLGSIDVNYTRWWLPVAQTETHLDQAIKLANEGKLYQANLALKAIEDSVSIDSVSFSDTPTTAKSTS